jgi:hypothetical protein
LVAPAAPAGRPVRCGVVERDVGDAVAVQIDREGPAAALGVGQRQPLRCPRRDGPTSWDGCRPDRRRSPTGCGPLPGRSIRTAEPRSGRRRRSCCTARSPRGREWRCRLRPARCCVAPMADVRGRSTRRARSRAARSHRCATRATGDHGYPRWRPAWPRRTRRITSEPSPVEIDRQVGRIDLQVVHDDRSRDVHDRQRDRTIGQAGSFDVEVALGADHELQDPRRGQVESNQEAIAGDRHEQRGPARTPPRVDPRRAGFGGAARAAPAAQARRRRTQPRARRGDRAPPGPGRRAPTAAPCGRVRGRAPPALARVSGRYAPAANAIERSNATARASTARASASASRLSWILTSSRGPSAGRQARAVGSGSARPRSGARAAANIRSGAAARDRAVARRSWSRPQGRGTSRPPTTTAQGRGPSTSRPLLMSSRHPAMTTCRI